MNENYVGTLNIHSAKATQIKDVDFVLSKYLHMTSPTAWHRQKLDPMSLCSSHDLRLIKDVTADIAAELMQIGMLRFEIVNYSPQCFRYSYTPTLGLFYAETDEFGSIQVPEHRILSALERAPVFGQNLRELADLWLGKAWDLELEEYRSTVSHSLLNKTKLRA
jgi:hypothetical protein